MVVRPARHEKTFLLIRAITGAIRRPLRRATSRGIDRSMRYRRLDLNLLIALDALLSDKSVTKAAAS